jgi:hypothetical protein
VAGDEPRDCLAVGRPGPEPDDLTRIRGLGTGLARRLADRGVTRFAQIAAWSAEDVRTIAEALGLGREISRRNWIEQAALLELRRPIARRPAATAGPLPPADARAVGLHHVIQHIRAAAGLRGEPSSTEAPEDGAGGPAAAPAAEPAQAEREEPRPAAPDGSRSEEDLALPVLEPEEASVTFVIRKRAPLPAGGATAQGGAEEQAGPPAPQWAESGAGEPLLALPDREVEEAEVVIVSRRATERSSRRS